ncbi:MAG: class I SAM-dependent methyltransferase [Alphaproteobacteria bacterium]|nr:class I SAM-dependent methyltransferase [Alphaproteobacteria bacterium]
MNSLSSHFDAEAASYPTDLGTDHVQARKWSLGRHAVSLAGREVTVVAVDPSVKMCAQLSNRRDADGLGARLPICAARLPDLPFADGIFDLVYCFSTLLLLPPDAQVSSLHRMARLLRPDAKLIVDVAGAKSLAIRYWRRHYRRHGLAGVFGMNRKQIHAAFESAGLEIVEMEPHGVLTQFLLFPGLDRISLLAGQIRGTPDLPGWDSRISRLVPGFAERWYIVARPSKFFVRHN